MIHKIDRLVAIGKYKDYRAIGDVVLKKLTLIYAENGTGKTTLTAVLRSLKEDLPELIQKRVTIDSDDTQTAHIIQRKSGANDIHHTFRPTGWTNALPEIEIFDAYFVNANIYSGFDFSEDHKRQLHNFAIGSQGVKIKQEIEANKADKTALRSSIDNIENLIVEQVANQLNTGSLLEFINITQGQNVNIDEKIAAAETALTNSRLRSIIQTLPSLNTLDNIEIPIEFNSIIADLLITIDTINDTALHEIFNSHSADLRNNHVPSPDNWLRTGYNYLLSKDDDDRTKCPFCQQEISNALEIIKAYTMIFNEQFNNMITRIQGYISILNDFNLGLIIQSIASIEQRNRENASLWLAHFPGLSQLPENDVIDNEGELHSTLCALKNLLHQKLHNPAARCNPDDSFQILIQGINDKIRDYNQHIANCNNAIEELRAAQQTEQQAEVELIKLQWVKKRFDPNINQLCVQLNDQKQRLRELENAYAYLVQHEEETSMAFLHQYRERINYYLNNIFRTPFQIEEVSHVRPQGRATQSKIGYKLTIGGKEIPFDHTSPNSVKECLSEGDKSTIALAFFLSKIDLDNDKCNKIIVLDDPLSSFDSSRRLNTIQIIKGLYRQVEQTIILSHNEYFLYEIGKGIPGEQKKTLGINVDYVANSSRIEPLGLDKLVQVEYFKQITKLEAFLQNPDINVKDDILGYIRNILEAHIMFKFYHQLSVVPENSRTFGRLIDKLVENEINFRSDTTPPTIISKLRLLNSISCKPHHGEPVPDYTEICMNPNTITVGELVNLIRDTFDLIDNRL